MSNMKYQVLILNSDYTPIDIISWQDAMVELLCKNSVNTISTADGSMLKYDRTVRDGKGNTYDIPAVLIRKEYISNLNRPASYSKDNIYARDLGICQYCGIHVKPGERTVDHVIPRAHWNPKRYSFTLNSFENLVLSCKKCNQKKRNRTPGQAGMKLIKQPKRITKAQCYYNKIAMRTSIPPQWRNFITYVNEEKE